MMRHCRIQLIKSSDIKPWGYFEIKGFFYIVNVDIFLALAMLGCPARPMNELAVQLTSELSLFENGKLQDDKFSCSRYSSLNVV